MKSRPAKPAVLPCGSDGPLVAAVADIVAFVEADFDGVMHGKRNGGSDADARASVIGRRVAAMVIFLLCVVFGPLLVFAPQLTRAKRAGLLEYGTLAERYVRQFDAKWLRGGAPDTEPLMGSSDIQSLADMGNSFAVVRNMSVAPVSREGILTLAAAVLVPIAPLLLTMMPMEALLRKLLGVLFQLDPAAAGSRLADLRNCCLA